MRKFIIPAIVLLAIITAGIFYYQAKPVEKLNPKTTGLPIKAARYYWPGTYWLEIADKKGWFVEAGLNVELIDTNPDYYQSLEDTVSGKLDTNGFYLFDLIKYDIKGADLVAVIYTDASFGSDGIVAKQEISSIHGLKGKTIGITTNSYHEYLLSVVLERNNLSISDVTLVNKQHIISKYNKYAKSPSQLLKDYVVCHSSNASIFF